MCLLDVLRIWKGQFYQKYVRFGCLWCCVSIMIYLTNTCRKVWRKHGTSCIRLSSKCARVFHFKTTKQSRILPMFRVSNSAFETQPVSLLYEAYRTSLVRHTIDGWAHWFLFFSQIGSKCRMAANCEACHQWVLFTLLIAALLFTFSVQSHVCSSVNYMSENFEITNEWIYILSRPV